MFSQSINPKEIFNKIYTAAKNFNKPVLHQLLQELKNMLY
jgi:hypothetical protein